MGLRGCGNLLKTGNSDWKRNCISTHAARWLGSLFETTARALDDSTRKGPYPKVNSAATKRSSGLDT